MKKRLSFKNYFFKYLQWTIGVVILALVFNLFFLPLKIVIGGTNGISIILNNLLGWSPFLIILTLYALALIIGFIFLGKKVFSKSLYGSIVYVLFIYLTSPLTQFVHINYDHLLLVLIIGAGTAGIASGLIYRAGFLNGGNDILKQIITKYFGKKMSKVGLVINSLIVFLGGFIFGWSQVFYALLVIYIINVVTDKIVLGISDSKAFYITTSHVEEVEKYILENLGHGVTIIDAEGGYSESKQKVLMCVIPTKDYFKLKEGLELIDSSIFFVVTDAYEATGGI